MVPAGVCSFGPSWGVAEESSQRAGSAGAQAGTGQVQMLLGAYGAPGMLCLTAQAGDVHPCSRPSATCSRTLCDLSLAMFSSMSDSLLSGCGLMAMGVRWV